MKPEAMPSDCHCRNVLPPVNLGLRFRRTALHSALFIAIGVGSGVGPVFPDGCVATCANAAQLGASMGISVNVIASAALNSHFQAKQLLIAPADIARGYVDALGATRFSVRTNSRQGYLMVFHPLLDIFDSVQVSGEATMAHLGRDGGVVVQRGWRPADAVQDLNFRFFLNALAVPGSHPWPLQLSVRGVE